VIYAAGKPECIEGKVIEDLQPQLRREEKGLVDVQYGWLFRARRTEGEFGESMLSRGDVVHHCGGKFEF